MADVSITDFDYIERRHSKTRELRIGAKKIVLMSEQATMPPQENPLTQENLFFSLVHWKNPVLSFMVFICIELFCYLVAVQDYTIITLLCYLVLVQLIVCLCYVNGTRWWLRFQGKTIPPDQFFSPREPLLDSEKLRFLLEPSVVAINEFVAFCVDICCCVDNTRTVTAVCVLIVAAGIGKYVSGVVLLALATFVAFVGPWFYDKYRHKIESVLQRLSSKSKKD